MVFVNDGDRDHVTIQHRLDRPLGGRFDWNGSRFCIAHFQNIHTHLFVHFFTRTSLFFGCQIVLEHLAVLHHKADIFEDP
jgi:hypothetical protein